MKKIDDKTLLKWIDSGKEFSLDELDEESRNRYLLHKNIHDAISTKESEKLDASFTEGVMREFYATPSLVKRASWKSPHFIFTMVIFVLVVVTISVSASFGSGEQTITYLDTIKSFSEKVNLPTFSLAFTEFQDLLSKGTVLIFSFLLLMILDTYVVKPFFQNKNA